MPDIEEQLRDRMEALTQAQERQGTAEERTQRLESQLEEKTGDVMKLTQRLKKNEEHNQRLSQTVDKLLSGMLEMTSWIKEKYTHFRSMDPFYVIQSHAGNIVHTFQKRKQRLPQV